MQLNKIMTTHIQGISAEQSVCEAAQMMKRLNVGSIPVFHDGEPIGIITDRDVAVRAVATGCDCSQKPVSEVMSGELITLPETADIEEAVQAMKEHRIRRVLITGADGEIVGIVSVGDVVSKTNKHGLSAELIETVSVPAAPA